MEEDEVSVVDKELIYLNKIRETGPLQVKVQHSSIFKMYIKT